jgi:hypothetical protein
MPQRKQPGQASYVEQRLDIGAAVHEREQEAAHVVERESLSLVGRDGDDQDGVG